MSSKDNKGGQVTIFIIIALIIIVAIALVFVLIKKPQPIVNYEENPQAYIEKCVGDSLKRNEQKIIEGNLYLNLSNNYILYSINKPQEKVPYLCKASQFYTPCINQEPMLIGLVKNEIKGLVEKDAANCFASLQQIMEKSGYEIKSEPLSLEINFEAGDTVADIEKRLILSKNDETRIYERFEARIQSPLYKLIDTARIIVNFESTLCEFNNLGWMEIYPSISIKKFVSGEGTKIYTLTDRETGIKINFAVKTCILPAGV
jgi:hypothetical protein